MSMTLDDHDVIVAFRTGDDTIFAEVVAEYRPELLRHAERSAPDAATAEDLVQETFVRAYRAFGRLPDDSRIRPWLHQILRNVCIDDAHRRRRETDKAEQVRAASPLVSIEPGPEDVLELDRDTTALADALASLPATHRDAFVQRVVVGLEYDEIAAREGVSEMNARARVSRARSTLRKALQGAAAIPIACYLMLRRPGRTAMAAGPDPSGATAATASTAAASPATVDTAGRLATSIAPMMEAAANVATGASHSVPLLTKAALGIGAVATVSFAAGPDRPVLVPPPVTEVAIAVDAADPIDDRAPQESDAQPATEVEPAPVVEPAAVPDEAEPLVASAPIPGDALVESEPTSDTATAAATDDPNVDAHDTPVATDTTVPTTTPTTTIAAVEVLPPLTGGSLQASVTVTPTGPRLDLAGPVTLTVTGASSGTLSGRIGIDEPDPNGLRRIDGSITLVLDTGTIDLRVAGHATTADESTLPLTLTGQYRATGDTGQLAPSGSFSGTLSDGGLTITLSA